MLLLSKELHCLIHHIVHPTDPSLQFAGVQHLELPWPFQVALDTCAQQNSSCVSAKEFVQKQLRIMVVVSAKQYLCYAKKSWCRNN
jgi:hypothetical protein